MTWRLQRYVHTPRVHNDVIFITLDIIISLLGGGGWKRPGDEANIIMSWHKTLTQNGIFRI